MKFAITGATGMIGSTLVQLLVDEGHEVIVIANPGSSRLSNIPKTPKVRIIDADISRLSDLCGAENCDVFFHLAWQKTFGTARDDAQIQCDNIQYALDAVQLAHNWCAKKFVGAGSQAEYGLMDVKLNGNLPANPSSGYGIAKFAAGKLCNLMCKQLSMEFNWARILSVFGERDGTHTLIMYLMTTLMSGREPELTKCEQKWDYIYSWDAANALYLIGKNGKNGKTYCVGSGDCRTLREYVEALRNIVAPDSTIHFGVKDYYPHQPMMLCADIEELTRDTGFVPKYSFEQGIERLLASLK